MSRLRALLVRIRGLFGRSAADLDLADEFAAHLDLAAAEYERRGLEPAEARRRARLDAGSLEVATEAYRDQRGLPGLDAIMSDLRFSVRSLRRTPRFSASVVLILGLGIGMATAVFSVYHTVLLQELPVKDQDRLVLLRGRGPGALGELPLPYPSYMELRQRSRTLRATAAYASNAGAIWPMAYEGTPLPTRPALVTGDFFQTLGTEPFLGRLIRPADDVAGAAPVLVLSNAAWQQFFHGDPGVIGRPVHFSGLALAATIVGVAPPGLEFPVGTDAWMPLLPVWPNAASDSAKVAVFVVGRLGQRHTIAQARSEFLHALHHARSMGTLQQMRRFGAEAQTLPDLLLGNVQPALLALAAAVGLLLLIACANVGNLLLVRAAARDQEMAVRQALGAGQFQLVRPLLTEGLVLGALGGATGFLFAWQLIRVLLAIAPPGLPRLDEIHPGVGLGLIAAGVTLISAVLFGLAPALRRGRTDLGSRLRSGTRGGRAGRRERLARDALVGWQVALGVVVLTGAGLLGRSLAQLQGVDLGYRPRNLTIAQLDWPWGTYPTPEQSCDPMERIVRQVKAVPGVVAATPIRRLPFSGAGGSNGLFIAQGESESDPRAHSYINVEMAGPDYFRTFGTPILRGRAFTQADRGGAPLVVMVDEAAARFYWPGQNPIGKRLRLNGARERNEWRTVVGVVADTRYRSLRRVQPTLYYPYRQFGFSAVVLAVRTVGRPEATLPAIRRAVSRAEPQVHVLAFHRMDDLLSAKLAQPRLDTFLLSAFAVVALLLSAVGLYVIVATAVRQRTHELCVRIALGATAGDIRRLVLGDAISVVATGAAVGVGAALASSRLLRSMLFHVSPADPVTLIGVTLLLVAVAVVATYLPARLATRTNPVHALRD